MNAQSWHRQVHLISCYKGGMIAKLAQGLDETQMIVATVTGCEEGTDGNGTKQGTIQIDLVGQISFL